MLSNIVEVCMHFWTELRGEERVTVREDITVIRGTFQFDNFYLNNHIEANQVNFLHLHLVFPNFIFRVMFCYVTASKIYH